MVLRLRVAIVSLPPSITYTWRGPGVGERGAGDRITVIEMRRGPRFFLNLNFDKARPCFVSLIPSWSGERVAFCFHFLSVFLLMLLKLF